MSNPAIKALATSKTGRVALFLSITLLLVTPADGQVLPLLYRIPDDIINAELRPVDNEMSTTLNPKHIVPITMVMTGDGTIIRRFIGWSYKESPKRVRIAVEETLKASKPKEVRKT